MTGQISRTKARQHSVWLINTGIGIMVLCAAFMTGLVLHREYTSASPEIVHNGSDVVANWHSLTDSGHSFGPVAAPVQIVVFSDFQCPACRDLSVNLQVLRNDFPDDIRYVYRHFPLSGHPHSFKAAHASECAAEQQAFSSLHEALFSKQNLIGEIPWTNFAIDAAVPNMAHFVQCLESETPEVIRSDRAVGESLGIRSTPTFIVNGRKFTGAPPYSSLRALVEAELATNRS